MASPAHSTAAVLLHPHHKRARSKVERQAYLRRGNEWPEGVVCIIQERKVRDPRVWVEVPQSLADWLDKQIAGAAN